MIRSWTGTGIGDRDRAVKSPLMGQHAGEPANPVSRPLAKRKFSLFAKGKGGKEQQTMAMRYAG